MPTSSWNTLRLRMMQVESFQFGQLVWDMNSLATWHQDMTARSSQLWPTKVGSLILSISYQRMQLAWRTGQHPTTTLQQPSQDLSTSTTTGPSPLPISTTTPNSTPSGTSSQQRPPQPIKPSSLWWRPNSTLSFPASSTLKRTISNGEQQPLGKQWMQLRFPKDSPKHLFKRQSKTTTNSRTPMNWTRSWSTTTRSPSLPLIHLSRRSTSSSRNEW